MITPETIEAACAQLRAQLTGTHVIKDKVDISIPTKITIADEDKPTIMVSVLADRKMRALVQQCNKEIGWHGTVTYEEDTNTYIIEDIFVFPQEITGTTVQSIDEHYGTWLMDTFNDEEFNKLRMHGHSHVNMGTSPSGVDLAYQENLTDRVQDFYIFIILNKRDDYYVCLYDLVNNYLYEKEDLYYDAEIEEVDVWAKDAISTHVTECIATYTNVVIPAWRSGWTWDATKKGYTAATKGAYDDYIAEQAKLNKPADKKKPGRPKGSTKKSAYEIYQQDKVKQIEQKKQKALDPAYGCEGNCIACQTPCAYYDRYSY